METMPKAAATLLRVRQVTDSDYGVIQLTELTRMELIDMILCSCSVIHGFKVFLTSLGIDGEDVIGELFNSVNIDDLELRND